MKPLHTVSHATISTISGGGRLLYVKFAGRVSFGDELET